MTRFTSIGRKRTYLEAGLNDNNLKAEAASTAETSPVQTRRKKKIKVRNEHSEGGGDLRDELTDSKNVEAQDVGSSSHAIIEDGITTSPASPPRNSKMKRRKDADRKRSRPLNPAEIRRQKRIAERMSSTICFACRRNGHAVKDCPDAALLDSNGDGDQTNAKMKQVVGICYRCGSKRHTLARCRKPSDPSQPLPYASCFVCSGMGHLASSCPQNKAKGVYPNGGCCKLCGDVSHLARDCALRKDELTKANAHKVMGVAQEARADEDDFHVFKRRKAEVEREEKIIAKVVSLVPRPDAHGPSKKGVKKVVYF